MKASRELDASRVVSGMDIVFLTETELPHNESLTLPGFMTFYPVCPPHSLRRLIALVDRTLATQSNTTILTSSHLDIWLELDFGHCGTLAVGGVYRQWSHCEEDDLQIIHSHAISAASSFKRCAVVGDFNLDAARLGDVDYCRRRMANHHMEEMSTAGFIFAGPMSPTYFSHGRYTVSGIGKAQRHSVLDHVYVAGLGSPQVTVDNFAATDHRPVRAHLPSLNSSSPTASIERCNLKGLSSAALCSAINIERLAGSLLLEDVDMVHQCIITELTAALDCVAPLKKVLTRIRHIPLYLSRDTLAVMAARDRAALVGSSDYRQLRNHSSHLVRRDKVNSARKFISGSVSSSGNSAARLWKLANTVLGRVLSSLPCKLVDEAGSLVTDKVELANMMNNYFISKIKKLRKGFYKQDTTPITDAVDPGLLDLTDGFALTPPSPSEVTKAILGLNETNATGLDGIPVSVLKLAAPIIALPVVHMLALSFAKGCVPMAFKTSIVTPIHKGKGKSISSPSSYRPVAILPALSKVMEKIVLQQLSPYLESKLPACQFGFRPGRNTLAAIATAHGAWAKATSGLITGVAAFDLTAAFDTIDHDLLCQKLSVLKIGPREVRWFKDYLNGRSQIVKIRWDTILAICCQIWSPTGQPSGTCPVSHPHS